MPRRDMIILNKVLSEIDIGIEMLGGNSCEDFISNEMLKRAVCMTVINIGELIKSISANMREKHPEVPWKAVAGMRDVTAHKYQTLRLEDVYNVVKVDLPVLKKQLTDILSEV